MSGVRFKSVRFLCAVVTLASLSPFAIAAESSAARAGIQETVDKTNVLLARGASVTEIADTMYEDDLMIIGEGEKALYRNLKSFMGPLATYVADAKTCKLNVIDPIRASGHLAVAFIFEHCAATKPGVSRWKCSHGYILARVFAIHAQPQGRE